MQSDNMPREADIVERLRGGVQEEGCDCERCELFREAAVGITRLRIERAGLLDQHSRDSKELSSLCQQRDDARRSADYWKAEHLAANVEIERLRSEIEQHKDVHRDRMREIYALGESIERLEDERDKLYKDVAQLRNLLADLELTREGSKVAHAELASLRAKIEAAPIIIYGRDCDCTSPSGGMHEGLIGKSVSLVREEG